MLKRSGIAFCLQNKVFECKSTRGVYNLRGRLLIKIYRIDGLSQIVVHLYNKVINWFLQKERKEESLSSHSCFVSKNGVLTVLLHKMFVAEQCDFDPNSSMLIILVNVASVLEVSWHLDGTFVFIKINFIYTPSFYYSFFLF